MSGLGDLETMAEQDLSGGGNLEQDAEKFAEQAGAR
jgi:hypothetical protein